MKSTTLPRVLVFVLLAGGFTFMVWQLLQTAPRSGRDRPEAPVPLVDVAPSRPADHAVTAQSAGPVVSAYELEIRPQVGGQIIELHPAFEPGGFIPAGETIVRIDDADYQLAVAAAQAEVAKAQATITLERGRRARWRSTRRRGRWRYAGLSCARSRPNWPRRRTSSSARSWTWAVPGSRCPMT